MNIKTLFFGITADLIGESELDLVVSSSISIGAFKAVLKEKYPQLKNIESVSLEEQVVDLLIKEAKATEEKITYEECVSGK